MPNILSLAYDPRLLKTRAHMLERRGHAVTSLQVGSLHSYDHAFRECRTGAYDLVLLGHSIPPAQREALVREVVDHCSAPILALLTPWQLPIRGATECVAAFPPHHMLDAVERLLTRPR